MALNCTPKSRFNAKLLFIGNVRVNSISNFKANSKRLGTMNIFNSIIS